MGWLLLVEWLLLFVVLRFFLAGISGLPAFDSITTTVTVV